MNHVRQQSRAVLREIKQPSKKGAVILQSVNVPGPKVGHGIDHDQAVKTPATKRRNNRDGQSAKASKPMLVLGR